MKRNSNYSEGLSSFYDIRVILVRNQNKINVSLRQIKDGKPKKKNFEMPPEMERFVPSWIKYGGKVISVYHRTKEGIYVNTTKKPFKQTDYRGGLEPPEAFKQQIEKLVLETYEHYFAK